MPADAATEFGTMKSSSTDQTAVVAVVVVLGALLAIAARAQPTGATVSDISLIGLGAGLVIWCAASAPWWVSAGACGVGAVTTIDSVIAAVGVVGTVGAIICWFHTRHGAPAETRVAGKGVVRPAVRALFGALAVNVLIRSTLDGFLGLSALIGVSVCATVVAVGVANRSHLTIVVARATIGLGVLFGILAVGGVGFAAFEARTDLRDGASLSRDASAQLRAGDYQVAADLFEASSVSFDRAGDKLTSPIALGARLVPGVSQNVRAGADLATAAGDATGRAADALRLVDPAALAVTNGSIDIESIRAVEAPLLDVQSALDELRSVADGLSSTWLVGPVQAELDELDAEFEQNEPRLDDALEAVRLAPQLLGGDGARRYLVLFTTPSEARGLGGFVGNYAEVSIDDGNVSVTDFDRRSRLEETVAGVDARCVGCPDELLGMYGRFGLTSGREDSMGDRGWSNITMPAHFPYVAESAAILYPQSGGRPVDGVIVMDPFVVEAFMQYTGPVTIPEVGVTVDPDNAADFILREQYALAGANATTDRIDALGSLGQQVITKLLTSSLPDPTTIAEDVGPLIAERRLLMWTDDAEEQELLERIGLLGALPELTDAGGFSVAVGNAAGNKVDAFLERDVAVSVERDESGERRLIADVSLRNGAPARGLPDYVIGNLVGLPDGYSRLLVTFYGPAGLDVSTLDGEGVDLEPGSEAGWTTNRHFIELAPGAEATYRIEYRLPATSSDGPLPPTTWEQPLAFRE